MKRKEMRLSVNRKPLKLFVMALLACFFLSVTAMAAPSVKKTEYEGKGRVDVSFKSKVDYKDVKVTVTGEDGDKQTCKIVEKDKDDLEFKIKNYKTGTKYNYTISGIKKKSESDYGSVSGSVKIPKSVGGIPMKEIDYDAEDRDVSFDFDTKVEWKSPKVSIKKDGKNYVKKIKSKDSNDIEVKVKKLKKGTKYTYTIKGIRKKGASDYTTITGTFTP